LIQQHTIFGICKFVHLKGLWVKSGFLKGLWVLMGKAPAFGRGFLLYELIVADWVELMGNQYLFVFNKLDGLGA
jgi:hypothetical protein